MKLRKDWILTFFSSLLYTEFIDFFFLVFQTVQRKIRTEPLRGKHSTALFISSEIKSSTRNFLSTQEKLLLFIKIYWINPIKRFFIDCIKIHLVLQDKTNEIFLVDFFSWHALYLNHPNQSISI